MRLVGVIEMAARSKNLYRLGAAFGKLVQQSGMQPAFNKNVGGHRAQHQYPTAFPPPRPSGAPSSSPVLGSTAMHSPSLQYPFTCILCPRASSSLMVSGE